jgi:hypothetical protein
MNAYVLYMNTCVLYMNTFVLYMNTYVFYTNTSVLYMNTYVLYMSTYVRSFCTAALFLEREMFQTKVVEQIRILILGSITPPPPQILALNETI